MGKSVVDVTGVPETGPDANVLHLEEDLVILGICEIVKQAGAVSVDSSTAYAFEESFGSPKNDAADSSMVTEHKKKHRKRNASLVSEYRDRTGRNFPPVYRIRIETTVDELGPKECEEYWRKRGAR